MRRRGPVPPAGHLLLERHDQADRQLRPAADGGGRADLSGVRGPGQGRVPDAGVMFMKSSTIC